MLTAIGGGMIGVIITAHIIYGLFVGAFASNRGMSFGEGFILSILFSPIIAIICVYLSQRK